MYIVPKGLKLIWGCFKFYKYSVPLGLSREGQNIYSEIDKNQ